MSLKKLLWEKPQTPYSRPPPLHLHVVETKEDRRVLSWTFEEGRRVKPGSTKTNEVAAITDGDSVTTVTLYEPLAGKLVQGQGYFIRNYSLRGQSPPFYINVSRETQFFKSAPIEVSEVLKAEARRLLHPPSPLLRIEDTRTTGFMSVEGEVVELSTIKPIKTGKATVPLKTATLQQNNNHISINLWREASNLEVQIGQTVRLTHLKVAPPHYGHRLQSTVHTSLQEEKEQ